jgi:hypothetical protein
MRRLFKKCEAQFANMPPTKALIPFLFLLLFALPVAAEDPVLYEVGGERLVIGRYDFAVPVSFER